MATTATFHQYKNSLGFFFICLHNDCYDYVALINDGKKFIVNNDLTLKKNFKKLETIQVEYQEYITAYRSALEYMANQQRMILQ